MDQEKKVTGNKKIRNSKKKSQVEEKQLQEEQPPDEINHDQIEEEAGQNHDMIKEAADQTQDNEKPEEERNSDSELSDHETSEQDNVPLQPTRKRQRGPTKMKAIAKDPSAHHHVEYTAMGEICGEGSVKLSSYLGTLVREHVPYTIDDWRKVSEEVKTVLWKCIEVRFDLDEELYMGVLMHQMGCLWRSSKSRLVTKIREASNNKERMMLRPSNVLPNEWRKYIKLKTSATFKTVSDKFKERRKKQIPHTCSRKGMVRLREEMKKESSEPSKVTRLNVWIKSRTKKDGTPVSVDAAEKIKKAAELEKAPSSSANQKEDLLTHVLGADNPGRLRAMGRGMSKSKLACLQIQNKCMEQMQEKQILLQRQIKAMGDEIAILRQNQQKQDTEVGENSAQLLSVNKTTQPKCTLVDWSGSERIVAEGRLLSNDIEDLLNGIPLGPDAVKILVENVIKPDAFLWRPAPNMFTMEQVMGEMIEWSADHCILSDVGLSTDDSDPKSPIINEMNKCMIMDRARNVEVIGEGRIQASDPKAIVNGLPLGPTAIIVYVDEAVLPDVFLWRPTREMRKFEDALRRFIAWPANRVSFRSTTNESGGSKSVTERPPPPTVSKSLAKKDKQPPQSHVTQSPAKKAKIPSQSPVRRSPRAKCKDNPTFKENQKIKLMDCTGKNRVVAEGRWWSNNPDQVVHFVPLGPNAVRVWVDAVEIKDVALWRKTSEMECMEDAHGSNIAWPADKIVSC